MLDDVLAIPEHLRDALWRIESARISPADSAGLLVCGMGGSAIGGDLAAAALADRLSRPLLTVRGYELPAWATADWTVLCSSYSGETEETLACFEAAGELGARRLVATTGGSMAEAARGADLPIVGLPGILPAPRTAVAYMFAIATQAAALSGVAPSSRTEIEAAATSLEASREALQELAARVAEELDGSLPVFVGADLTAAAARRWKGQVNENAKLPAFFSELPEADHNELCGWAGGAATGARLAAVLLEDRDQHRRERRRFELTAEAIEADGSTVVRIETVGESRSERLLWAVMLADLVSLALAESRGVDPLPVEAIEGLKAALGRP
jgi:glucose/mannose-6-phosphate isomerase